jgi:hypothetical protein
LSGEIDYVGAYRTPGVKRELLQESEISNGWVQHHPGAEFVFHSPGFAGIRRDSPGFAGIRRDSAGFGGHGGQRVKCRRVDGWEIGTRRARSGWDRPACSRSLRSARPNVSTIARG